MRRLHIAVGVFLTLFAGLAMADPATISISSILTSAAGAAAGGIVSSLFAKNPSKADAPAPAVEKPTAMPTADDAAMEAAKKKSLMAQIQRRGRASTILTGDTTADAMG